MKFKSSAQRKAVMANLNQGRTPTSSANVPFKKVPSAYKEYQGADSEAVKNAKLQFIVEGRRWRDINGNTYHSVVVTDADTGKVIGEEPFQYGYEEAYKQTAMDILVKSGRLTKENIENLRGQHELKRKMFHFDVADVSRKKDL